ncbi:hypothetical protein GCM10009118_27080 [Wandonia haliotis]|uniref:Uncharacterized protein n=1 Tax=Wandonia haliotis TaxID=574963 RepID=A0ABP3Y436_9FLAO
MNRYKIITILTLLILYNCGTSKNGSNLIETKYSNLIQIDSSGIYKGLKGNLWGLVTKDSSELTEFKYSDIGTFQKGFAAFSIFDNGGYGLYKGYLDLKGNEFIYPYLNFESLNWNISNAPKEIPDSSHILGKHSYLNFNWTLPSMLNHNLQAFILEPQSYDDLGNLDKICTGYGMLISGGNFSGDYMYEEPDKWNSFKLNTLYNIIGNENLRELTWKWAYPYYKDAFSKLNPFVKQTYQDCFKYLNDHIENFNRKKYEEFLMKDEKNFAKFDINGNIDSKRKLSAFVDRLILVHEVISPEDAKRWINKIYSEVRQWK